MTVTSSPSPVGMPAAAEPTLARRPFAFLRHLYELHPAITRLLEQDDRLAATVAAYISVAKASHPPFDLGVRLAAAWASGNVATDPTEIRQMEGRLLDAWLAVDIEPIMTPDEHLAAEMFCQWSPGERANGLRAVEAMVPGAGTAIRRHVLEVADLVHLAPHHLRLVVAGVSLRDILERLRREPRLVRDAVLSAIALDQADRVRHALADTSRSSGSDLPRSGEELLKHAAALIDQGEIPWPAPYEV